jgi:hypothetical protein
MDFKGTAEVFAACRRTLVDEPWWLLGTLGIISHPNCETDFGN